MDALGPFERGAAHRRGGLRRAGQHRAGASGAAWARARGGAVLGADRRPRAAARHPPRRRPRRRTAPARCGIASRVPAWAGAKPATGIQAAARAARYRPARRAPAAARASCTCCWRTSARTRPRPWRCARAAGSGAARPGRHARGARGRGLRLLRPLLAVPKARLVATLRAAGQPWPIDPSNAAPLRSGAPACGRTRASTPTRLVARASLAPVARTGDDLRLAGWLARHARPHPLGFVRARRARPGPAWRASGGGPDAGALLATVGGSPYPRAARRSSGWPPRCSTPRRRTRGDRRRLHRRAPRAAELVVAPRAGPDPSTARAAAPGARQVLGRPLRRRLPRRAGARSRSRALGADGASRLPRRCAGALRAAGVPAVAVRGAARRWGRRELVACPPLGALRVASAAGFSATDGAAPAWPLAGAAFAGVNVVSKPQPPYLSSRYRGRSCGGHGAGRSARTRCPG